MASAEVELRPVIDRGWLEAEARRDPLPHAFALWDLERLPSSVRFVSAVAHGRTVAYLLVWLGRPGRPVLHWVGEADGASALADRFPPAPFEAVVPEGAVARVLARSPGARATTLGLLWRDTAPSGLVDTTGSVRRLRPDEAGVLSAWSHGEPSSGRPDFGTLDLAEEPVWGAFDSGRLVGVTRAEVRLPIVWVVSGVYVDPEARGRGLGRRLVAALVDEAHRRRAPTGLYVREDAAPARRVYGLLGYREIGRKVWIRSEGRGPPPTGPDGPGGGASPS